MSEVVKKPKAKKRSDNAPIMLHRAIIDGSNFDAENNSVPIVFATDTPVLTRDRDGEFFYEVLSMNPAHIRQDRINSGAPILDNHDDKGSIQIVQLGVIENPQVVGNEYRAIARFSKRDQIKGLVQDIKEGIVKNVSAGYLVYHYKDITKPGDKMRTLLADDWEPKEVSMVPIPGDYRSNVRSAQFSQTPEINNSINNMEDKTKKPEPVQDDKTPVTDTTRAIINTDDVTKAAMLAERKRGMDIRDVVRKAGIDVSFADEHIQAETPIDEVRRLVIDKWAAQSDDVKINGNNVSAGEDRTRTGTLLGLEEALTIRAFGVDDKDAPTTEEGKRAANGIGRTRTLMGISEGFLSVAGIKFGNFNDDELAKRAMTSTDFPLTMANVMNKNLKKRFNAAQPKWKKIATAIPVNDFKAIYSVRVDGSFVPTEITEEGEYTMANFKETGDNFGLKTWGKMTSLSRKMIINDDLGAFTRFAPFFANGVLRKQASIVYGLLTANAFRGRTLGSDNTALFHANHNNLNVGGAGPLSLATLNAAKVALSRQLGLDGEPIDIEATYLFIPPELEFLARQLLHSVIIPNTVSAANPLNGAFEIVVDKYLTDAHRWYLAASPSDVDMIKYATLNGQEGIFTEQEYDFKTDALLVKARTDFNATVDEYVGLQMNDGQ